MSDPVSFDPRRIICAGVIGGGGRGCIAAALLSVALFPGAVGQADDTAKLATILAPAIERGGSVTIPPGEYDLDGATPLTISSHMTVSAHGARFHLPKTLGDKARVVLFAGENVRDFRFSALGDTMHIQKSRGVVFANNHLTGSRMGAFFLAEFCKDATITGNTVDGTNGSRVMSVEKSCEDVTITGNTFRNGGRGSWINQPRNFVLADNVFVNNTTKCERDPRRGRRSFLTADYERYAELYFTTHEPGGRYGNVTIRGNIFTSGASAEHAISFAPGGDTIVVSDNLFSGPVRDIPPAIGCENVTIRENLGLQNTP